MGTRRVGHPDQQGWAESVLQLAAAGGWVAWVLVAATGLLWFCVLLRLFALAPDVLGEFQREARATLQRAGDDGLAQLDALAQRCVRRLAAMRGLLRSLVMAAPLLGLLGTVGGMVETFNSIGASTSAESTVAGGISTALITTQLGLMTGVAGLLAARLLERREDKLAQAIGLERARVARELPAEVAS